MTAPPTAPATGATRFDALDGIRGLAAMAVVIDHYTHQSRLPGAWTVVDLFFMLSGFVLCHSHAGKIAAGRQGLGAFMWSRVHRLGPLYWVACLMGAAAVALACWRRPELDIGAFTLLGTLLGSLLMLPDFGATLWPHGDGMKAGTLFPLNPPAWTTFFQLLVNVAFFWALTRLKAIWRWPVALLALAGLNWMEWYLDSINPGWGQGNFLMGLPRACIEFAVGVALYRVQGRLPTVHPLLAMLPLGAFLVSFLSTRVEWQLLSVLLFAPATIVAAARTSLPPSLIAFSRRLGELSYPLYISHMPVWGLMWAALPMQSLPGAARTLAACVAAVGCALLLVPLERLIRRHLPRG